MRFLNTIWKKLLLVYLVIVIPLIAILIIDAFGKIDARRDIVLANRIDRARLSATILEEFFNEVLEDQQALGLIITEREHTPQEIADFVKPVKETHFLSGVWFLNANKQVVAGVPNVSVDTSFAKKEAIKKLSNNNFVSDLDKNLKLSFVSRIVREGQTVGFLYSEMPADNFSNIFPTSLVRGGVAIIDGNAILAFQNVKQLDSIERNWKQFKIVNDALKGKSRKSISFKPPGFRTLMGALVTSDGSGWVVGSFIGVGSALKPITMDVLTDFVIVLGVIVIALVISMFIAASIARPVRALTGYAQGLSKGELDKKIEVKTGDEVQILSQNLDYMRRRLKDDINEIKLLQKKQEEIANTLQKSFLPTKTPRIDGLDFGIHYESATEAAAVGGDFYDFISLGHNKWAIVAGDVSGKGIEAAADTAMVKYILRGFLLQGFSLTDSVSQLNNMAQKQTAPGHFISLVAVIYEGQGRFQLVNAGHPQPLLNSGKQSQFIKESGLAVGVFRNQKYESVEVNLDPDDLLVLYTDGLTEAKVGSELFGEERLSLIVADNANDSAEDIAKTCAITAKEFAKGILNDDLLALVVKRTS